MIICKSASEIEIMKEAGRIVAEVLLKIEDLLEPGTTTAEIDRIAEKEIRAAGATPAFKGYAGRISSRSFPSSLCISINEEVVHGIPSKEKILLDGDIVSLDIGMQYPAKDGMYTDMAKTIGVGKIRDEAKRLIKTTQKALENGIKECRGGNLLSQVSAAIQQTADKEQLAVVRTLVGHGVGQEVHEDPQIPNFVTGEADIVLKPGMTLALEPMINIGDYQVKLLDDGWTFITEDEKLSAHFEHTVLVTDGEPEVLTRL